MPAGNYELPTLKGIRFNIRGGSRTAPTIDPLHFTFIFNKSDLPLTEDVLRAQAENIGKYFLAALTIPEEDLWVNLSPYEADRIMPDKLSQTDLGKDMLGEDYVLKQLAASLTHPDTPQGKLYWDALRMQNAKLKIKNDGNFQKVWIVPDKIHIYESPSMVVIDYAKLKVLCEDDYLAMDKNTVGARSPRPGQGNPAPTDAFKKHILPSIEQEVNHGKHFAHLRQLYSAIILALWFKDKLKQSILNDTYFGKAKIKGADTQDPNIKQKIYEEYVKAFNQKAYNLIRKEIGPDPFPGEKNYKRAVLYGGNDFTEIRAAADGMLWGTKAGQECVGPPSAQMARC